MFVLRTKSFWEFYIVHVDCWLWWVCVCMGFLCVFFTLHSVECWIHIDLDIEKLDEIHLIQFIQWIWFSCNNFRTNYFATFDHRACWTLNFYVCTVFNGFLLFFFVASILNVSRPDWLNGTESYVCLCCIQLLLFFRMVLLEQHILCVNNFEWFIGNISKTVDTFRNANKKKIRKGNIFYARNFVQSICL